MNFRGWWPVCGSVDARAPRSSPDAADTSDDRRLSKRPALPPPLASAPEDQAAPPPAESPSGRLMEDLPSSASARPRESGAVRRCPPPACCRCFATCSG